MVVVVATMSHEDLSLRRGLADCEGKVKVMLRQRKDLIFPYD